MRNIWFVGVAMLLAGSLFAQGPYYRERGYGGPGLSEIDQVQADVERAISTSYLSDRQRKTLERAQMDLYDFERAWTRGKFSYHELDEAIGRIQSVANNGRMSYRDRNILQDDANRLRDLRARGRYDSSRYGYR